MVLLRAYAVRSVFCALFCAAALAVVPMNARAAVAPHYTLPPFQQNVRADVLLEPFNGAAQNYAANAPNPVSGNGYTYAVQSAGALRRDTFGMASRNTLTSLDVAISGQPVSAFGATLRVLDSSLSSTGGIVNFTLSTGETFGVPVAPGGTFFGFTSTQPFTLVRMDSPPLVVGQPDTTLVAADDVYVGTSLTVVVASNECADAQVIAPVAPYAPASYPFTTAGATAASITNACDSTIDTGADVWYRLVSPVHGMVTLGTCGCSYDSILRVFAACPSPLGEGQVACNDDACLASNGLNRASQVSFRVAAGEDYLIRISGYNGESGSGTMSFSLVPDCRADFNHNGGKEVQDIFDFLAAWFGAC